MRCLEPDLRRRTMARRGTTLIELLAGLLVLGVLLVAVGLARARFMRQSAEADQRLADVRAADSLLSKWLDGPSPQVPLHDQGKLDGSSGRIWRTRVKNEPSASALGALIVRLEIVDTQRSLGANAPAEFAVDFLVHDARTERAKTVAQAPSGMTQP